MGILLFILGMLKYILIVLLCIFIFLFAFVAFFLLMPIRYKAVLTYNNALAIEAKATWIFKILTIIYSNGAETGAFKFLLFGRDFFNKEEKKKKNSGGRKKSNKKVKKEENTIGDDIESNTILRGQSEAIDAEDTLNSLLENTELEDIDKKTAYKIDNIAEADTHKKNKRRSPNSKKKVNIKREKNSSDEYIPEEEAQKTDENTTFAEKINELRSKIKSIYDYPDKKLIVKATTKLVKRLLAAIKPKKFKLNVEIGFDDPSVTGRAIGALAFFAGVNKIDMTLSGNFQEKTMNITADIKGKIVLWSFLWPLILYILNKPIWKIVKPIIFRRDKEDE